MRATRCVLGWRSRAAANRSRYPEGRDEIVRQWLPRKFPFEVLEQADRLQLVAIEKSGVTPRVCLSRFSCAHMLVPDGEGSHHAVSFLPSTELTEEFARVLEPKGLFFDQTQGLFGGWVEKK